MKVNVIFKSILILSLILGLLSYNFFQIFTDKRLDIALDIITGFCLITSLFNIIISLLGLIEYFNSFYFYVEITSLIIYIFDFQFLKNNFF